MNRERLSLPNRDCIYRDVAVGEESEGEVTSVFPHRSARYFRLGLYTLQSILKY